MTDVPISACLTFNKNLWIWPKFRNFHVIYKIRPDGNFGSEKEDMSGKIRTYGSPIYISFETCHEVNIMQLCSFSIHIELYVEGTLTPISSHQGR